VDLSDVRKVNKSILLTRAKILVNLGSLFNIEIYKAHAKNMRIK